MVDLFKLKTDELKALVHYKEVLEEGNRFPKGFWAKEANQKRYKDNMPDTYQILF